jgi:hypothetical protein
VVFLSEQEQKKSKKKSKKKKQQIILETEVESELSELVEVLEELEKEKKYVDIQIYPHCKKPNVRRVSSIGGDVLSNMGLTQPKFECLKCGWRRKILVKATNKPTTIKDVVLMAEANEIDNES